jgi:hypothetical protein
LGVGNTADAETAGVTVAIVGTDHAVAVDETEVRRRTDARTVGYDLVRKAAACSVDEDLIILARRRDSDARSVGGRLAWRTDTSDTVEVLTGDGAGGSQAGGAISGVGAVADAGAVLVAGAVPRTDHAVAVDEAEVRRRTDAATVGDDLVVWTDALTIAVSDLTIHSTNLSHALSVFHLIVCRATTDSVGEDLDAGTAAGPVDEDLVVWTDAQSVGVSDLSKNTKGRDNATSVIDLLVLVAQIAAFGLSLRHASVSSALLGSKTLLRAAGTNTGQTLYRADDGSS